MTKFEATEACLWRDEAKRFDRMLEPFGERMLSAAGLSPGDHVLDVGCGSGTTTLRAAERTGDASGIDISSELIELASKRAATRRGVRFVCADAATYPYAAMYDAVISRFGMMLFADPVAAFHHIARFTRRGGTITYVTWTEPWANAWHALPYEVEGSPIEIASVGPFGLADRDGNVRLLRESGFSDISLERIEHPVWIASDVEDAVAVLVRSLSAHAPSHNHLEEVVDRARPRLAQHEAQGGIYLPAVALLCHATRTERPC